MVLNFADAAKGIDGKDHINVFSKGKTELGKLLSNFAHTPFKYKGRLFESVEGFWFWKVSGGDVKFQMMYGLEAKQRGKEIANPGPRPTRAELKEVYIAKLEANPDLKRMLLESILPFAHYYDYPTNKVCADKYLWTVELWDELRNKTMSKYEKIFGTWYRPLKGFIESDEFKKIGKFLKDQQNKGVIIYPLFDDVFRAFRECSYGNVSVVMLTNNCYVEGEMDGLAFSSAQSKYICDTPKVLEKVFDAVEKDVCDGLYIDRNNDLVRWTRQGVLLLNVDLTTEKGKPGSHIELWKPFIQHVMKVLRDNNTGLIYCFIGKKSGNHYLAVNEDCNDIYTIEHPMNAVLNERPWKHKEIFSTINRVTKFLNDKEIKWTD